MSIYLGESLIFDLSSGLEEGKTINLVERLNENPPTVTIVATVDEEGIPNTAPIGSIIAKDEKTLLMSSMEDNKTTQNLRHNGRTCIELLASDDMAVGIKGKANLIKESMNANENMTLWEIDVEKVKQDTSPAVVVTSGPSFKPRSEKARIWEQELIEEMRGLI